MPKPYLLAFFWGWLIAFSFLGWGWLLAFLFKREEAAWGTKAVLGYCFLVVVGGILNLTNEITKLAVSTLMALGLALVATYLIADRVAVFRRTKEFLRHAQRDKSFAVVVLAVCALFLFRYATAVSTTVFNEHDDYHGYFALAAKMQQTGNLGQDPFSERRLVSSLGGETFLDMFVLLELSWNNLHLMDLGVGLIVLVSVLVGILKRRPGISPRLGGVIIFSFFLVPTPYVNITSSLTGVCIFLVVFDEFFFANRSTRHWVADAFFAAVLFAALCTLKSSFVPIAGLIFVGHYLKRLWAAENKDALPEFLLSVTLILIFLAPWMLSLYRSSGTLFYPLLGKGYSGTRYGYLSAYREMGIFNLLTLAHESFNILFMTIALLFLYWLPARREKPEKDVAVLVLCCVVLAIAANAFATGGYGVYRYTFPFVLAAVIVMTTDLVNYGEKTIAAKVFVPYAYTGLTIVALVAGSGMEDLSLNLGRYTRPVLASLKNNAVASSAEIDEYRKLQEVIPANAAVAERLDKPFLLDFRRNAVYIFDYPGGASLPPGMPFFEGEEPLARYFLSKSIRYVAYSYASQALFPKEASHLKVRLEPGTNAWLRSAAKYTFEFQDNLAKLGNSRKRIYDDGKIFVLDLASASE